MGFLRGLGNVLISPSSSHYPREATADLGPVISDRDFTHKDDMGPSSPPHPYMTERRPSRRSHTFSSIDHIDCSSIFEPSPELASASRSLSERFARSEPHLLAVPSPSQPQFSYASVVTGASKPLKSTLPKRKVEQACTELQSAAEDYEAIIASQATEIDELKKNLQTFELSSTGSTTRARVEAGEHEEQRAREMQHLAAENENLQGQVTQLKTAGSKMKRAYNTLKTRCQTAEQSLAGLREFVDLADDHDLAHAIQGLKDINELVDEISYQLTEPIAEDIVMTSTPERLVHHLAENPWLGGLPLLLSSSIQETTATLDEVLYPLIRCILSTSLVELVLAPFSPLLSGAKSGNDIFHAIQGHLRSTGNRAKAAQWRAITHQALEAIDPERRQESPARISSYIISILSLVLNSCGIAQAQQGSLGPIDSSIRRLVTEAIAWQRLIRQRYLFTDLRIIFPSSVPGIASSLDSSSYPVFDSETMEDKSAQAQPRSPVVVGTYTVGLLHSGKAEGERTVLLKSEVCTEKAVEASTPRASKAFKSSC